VALVEAAAALVVGDAPAVVRHHEAGPIAVVPDADIDVRGASVLDGVAHELRDQDLRAAVEAFKSERRHEHATGDPLDTGRSGPCQRE
jgi:hypothetical protein